MRYNIDMRNVAPAVLAALVPLAGLGFACARRAPPAAPSPPPTATVTAAPPVRPALTPAAIDVALEAEWKKDGTVPAPSCDDATFVRRATLDIVGRIPDEKDARAFVADKDPEKRRKLVDVLLASPAYAEHWMNYWDDVLMGKEVRAPVVDRVAFRGWLRSRFEANTPWNRLVSDLVAATGQNSLGGARVRIGAFMPMSEAPKEDAGEVSLDQINGAVNWTLRFQEAPQDLAGSASRIFLGVQIQCAQCHDHKTEKWKQDDFRRLASAFLHLRVDVLDGGKSGGMVRRVEIKDFGKVLPRLGGMAEMKPILEAKAAALDGTDLERGPATRQELAAWMTSPNNPWFARAIVNRMWGHFLGRGFVDPVDDLRASNPATMPDLLDAITKDFVAHDHDLKRLVRTVAATRAYGLSASAKARVDADNRAWARFKLVPLGPEEMLNALFQATNAEGALRQANVQNIDALRFQLVRNFTFLFDVDEEADTHDYIGSVTQALTLLNGNLTNYGARTIPGTALTEILARNRAPEENVAAVYWRVLSRPPSDGEMARWTRYVREAVSPAPQTFGGPRPPRKKGGPDALQRLGNKIPSTTDPKKAAYEDLFWTLLNSSEFVFNH